ncbi:hypothetical protein Cgig2_019155 [Carnegiea gigantea]|uniref:Uncharacterized protein n=1 Tax=Carnegiea gigantea TaxID=171969 RepID=A0A9Q1GPS4_9CARY|nr:hypothetical protein Cgig2_019155 [Carnegiea gigantea]
MTKSTIASTPYATHSKRTAGLEEQEQASKPPPMTACPKQQNARKYCEFHKRSGQTTTERRELKKALHELADKRPWFLRREQEFVQPQLRDKECSTEVMATITGGYNAQLRSAQQVFTTEQRPRTTVPAMVFGGKEAPQFTSPYNDPLVVKVKIASAIIRRILIDTGSC